MPFDIKQKGDCPPSKPYGVYSRTTGRKMGCFATRADAREQQQALYANVPDARTSSNVVDIPVVRTITPIPEEMLDEPIGAPAQPPIDWFVPPEDLASDAKLTIVLEGPDRGRVYGRVAPRKQCLLSRPDECWTISDSPSDFRGAHQGETVTADGRVIATANIGGMVRHAPYSASFTEAQDWYENTASRLMRVRYGADVEGITTAGAVVPSLTYRQALDIMQSPVSGDWRWRQEFDAYDMSGVVLVNMPGFPLGVRERKAAAAWGDPLIGTWIEVEAMVASLFNHEGGDMPGECTDCHDYYPPPPLTAAVLTSEQRNRMTKSGVAMPNGDFPIPDMAHLRNALARYSNYTGDKAAAKAHICRRGRALGQAGRDMVRDFCGGGSRSASANVEDVADEADVDLPEFLTRDEALAMVEEAKTAILASVEERVSPIERDVSTLNEMATETLDAAFAAGESV